MTSLVLLEFDAAGIKQPSRSAVAAALKLGEVHALVAGAEPRRQPRLERAEVSGNVGKLRHQRWILPGVPAPRLRRHDYRTVSP